jgi:hypothetical protein
VAAALVRVVVRTTHTHTLSLSLWSMVKAAAALQGWWPVVVVAAAL